MSAGIDMSFVMGRAQAAGSRAQAKEPGQLFRVLAIGDFSGRASRRSEQEPAPTFMPLRIDLDKFETVLQRLEPKLKLQLPQMPDHPVVLSFGSLEDFEPDALFARLPLFTQLRELRARLSDPSTFEQAAAELRASDAGATRTPASVDAPAVAPAAATEDDGATLQRLLGSMPSAPGVAATRAGAGTVDGVVDRLVRHLVAPYVVPATSHLQQPMIDSLDRAIGDTMRALLHDPQYRALEGAWRAVDQFVRSVEMDGQVLFELVDASAADVLDSLIAAEGDAARMPLAHGLAARRMHEGEEEAYALVVGLYEFGTSTAELALLAGLGGVAAHEGAAFVGSASPALAAVDGSEQWAGVMPTSVDSAALARWNALRGSAVASHIALVWPRLLSRLPYGAKTQPVASFGFEELPGEHRHDLLPWRLAALDAAAALARAFSESGWELDTGNTADLDELPAFIDRSGESPRFQAVAEFFMNERQAQALGQVGLIPLMSHRTLPRARLGGWRSISAKGTELTGPWQR